MPNEPERPTLEALKSAGYDLIAQREALAAELNTIAEPYRTHDEALKQQLNAVNQEITVRLSEVDGMVTHSTDPADALPANGREKPAPTKRTNAPRKRAPR